MYWKMVEILLFLGVATAAPLQSSYLPPPVTSLGSTGSIGGPEHLYGGNIGTEGNRDGAGNRGVDNGLKRTGGANIGGYSGSGGFIPASDNGAGGAGGIVSTGYQEGVGNGASGGASGPFVPIISYENKPNTGDGSYSWSYETGNDIKAQEKGYLNNYAPEGPGETAEGSYSYIAPDGQLISVSYTADGNGFVPQGAHLPTPPPVPQEILESLQKNAADEAAGIFDDGTYREEGAGGYDGVGGYDGSQDSINGGVKGINNAGYGGASDNGISGGFQDNSAGYSYPKPNK